MTDSGTFDKDECVKDMTEAGLALPAAEAIAYEFVYLDACRYGETTDAGLFEKDRCVQRLTDAGFARRVAEAIAEKMAQLHAYLRGQGELRREYS